MMWFVLISGLVLVIYTIVILQFRGGIGKNLVPKTQLQLPNISIVVALKNEAENVKNLVASLKSIDYPKENLEIIMVNDHSTDDTLTHLKNSTNISVYSNAENGKKRALELGIKKAKGDWIAVTDADCELSGSWLKSMTSFITEETKMVLGPVFIADGSGFLTDLQTIEFLALQGATSGSAGNSSPISANGANMLFKKKAFEQVNPYEDNYHLNTGDDQFLMMAIHNEFSNGIVYAQHTDAMVHTKPVRSWNKYIQQRVRWASKGAAYSDWSIKLKGVIILTTSLVVVSSFLYGLFLTNYYLAFGFVFAKMLVDSALILPMKRFSGTRYNPLSLMVSAIFYPFMVVFAVVVGGLKISKVN